MTPAGEARLRLAVTELADAIVAAVGDADGSGEPDQLLTIEQARHRLAGIARSTVYGLIGSGQLRSIRVGGRRLIPASYLAEFLADENR